MALIHRRGCTFFIRSVRRGDRVTSEYVGSGPLAELAFASARNLREHREAEQQAHRAEMAGWLARLDATERQIRAYCALTDALVLAAMDRAGYHRHKRGEWRRRRMRDDLRGAKEPAEDTAGGLLAPAGHGDSPARETAGQDDGPGGAWGIDSAEAAESALIRWAVGEDPIRREQMRRRLARHRAEVAGENPTVLESLLARRVALTALEVDAWDDRLARCDELSTHDGCIAFVDHLERRRGAAHRRFLLSVKALATVQRKAPPAVRVYVERRVTGEAPADRGEESRPANHAAGLFSGTN